MRTDTVTEPGNVAVLTEQLEAILWEPMFAQPGVNIPTAATNFAAMLCSIVVHMVNGKDLVLRLSAAFTSASVSFYDLLTKFRMPELKVGFFALLLTHMLAPIAISAKQLKALLGKAVLSQPHIKASSIACALTMLSAVIIDVVYGKKRRVRLATHSASAPVNLNHFIVKCIQVSLNCNSAAAGFPAQLILLITALFAKAALISSWGKALNTKALVSSTSIGSLAHSALASLAVELQTISHTTKSFIGKPLLAPWAILFACVVTLAKIKDTLHERWYNVSHDMSSMICRTTGPDCAVTQSGPNRKSVPPVYHKPASGATSHHFQDNVKMVGFPLTP